MSSNHNQHKPKIEFFTQEDLNHINQWRANQAMEQHGSSQAAGFLAAMFFLLGLGAAWLLPENFVGYHNVNSNIAFVLIAIAALFALLSRVTGSHHDPTEKYRN